MNQDSKSGSLIPEAVLLAITYSACLRLIKTKESKLLESSGRACTNLKNSCLLGQKVDIEEKQTNSHLV